VVVYLSENLLRLLVIKPEVTFLCMGRLSKIRAKSRKLKDLILNKAKLSVDYAYVFGEDGKNFCLNIENPKVVSNTSIRVISKSYF